MKPIQIRSHEITSACVLKVEVGTNCPQGGDAGHGGKTVLRFINLASTAMEVSADGCDAFEADTIEVCLYGDCAGECFVEALDFAVRTLRAQLGSTSETATP